MKKKVLALLAATVLVLAASTAWAVPTIDIDYLVEGIDPVVTPSGFSFPLINPVVATLDGFASITGSLFSNFINDGDAAAYGIKMYQLPCTPCVTDFATLLVSPKFLGVQTFELIFWAEEAIGFNAALIAFNLAFPDAASLIEDGTFQSLFSFSGLQVNAATQMCIPIPGSVLLFGSGLLGLVPVWRFRRRA